MMHITLFPRWSPGTVSVIKTGDVLTINGEAFDFSGLPEGGTYPEGVVPCPWIIGPIERSNDVLRLTLVLPHGADPPQHVAFPEALIDPPDGVLDLPFADWRELVTSGRAAGGTVETYVLHRWGQPDAETVEFIPDPRVEEEIVTDVAD